MKRPKKSERRNAFIFDQLAPQAENFSSLMVSGIEFGLGEATKNQIRRAISAAYVAGASAAMDVEDGKVRKS